MTKEMVEVCVNELYNEENISHFQNIAFHLDPDFGDSDTFYLFYGGSSRIPRISSLFEEFFGNPILKTVN